MAEAIILEFRDIDPALYGQVNELLGLDPDTGAGDWPDGLLSHTGGVHPDNNGLTVFEVWDSKQAQESFMSERLGPALATAEVPQPVRVEWLNIAGHRVL